MSYYVRGLRMFAARNPNNAHALAHAWMALNAAVMNVQNIVVSSGGRGGRTSVWYITVFYVYADAVNDVNDLPPLINPSTADVETASGEVVLEYPQATGTTPLQIPERE